MIKFPWADGTPFDWDKAEEEGRLDDLFVHWSDPTAVYNASSAVLTRDPRLYESIGVNGVPDQCNATGQLSGDPLEIWISGRDAGTAPDKQTGAYGTGFVNNKFFGDVKYSISPRIPQQWPALRLSDLLLTCAEARLQAKNDFTGAIKLIDEVRARVGLKGVVECNPGKNLTSNKQALLDMLLNERACELGLEDSRLFDMIRYKLKNEFENPLHILYINRLDENDNVLNRAWYGADKDAKKPFPSHFRYEVRPITTGARVWWSGFEPKWYLSAIPLAEISKGYLIQNPGW